MARPPTSDLQRIPGVGPSIEQDLLDLGIRSVAQLESLNAERLYAELCELRGGHIDRCVLYVFRTAVYFASTEEPRESLLKWWNWKDAAAVDTPA